MGVMMWHELVSPAGLPPQYLVDGAADLVEAA
jgi:hypothetical protein